MKKKVYLAFSTDVILNSHIKLINKAKNFGNVIVGILTDKAICEYKSLPNYNFKQRVEMFNSLKNIYKIVPQDTLDYTKNLNTFRPDYVIHGDDWKKGIQKKTRKKVINALKKWSGKLIEVKYDKDPKTAIYKSKFKNYSSPDLRVSKLSRLIESKTIVRTIETHSALSALITDKMQLIKRNKFFSFDALWSSSLTDSLLRGKPDNQSVDYTARFNMLNDIFEATSKPLIFDADNGGKIEHISFLIRSLERMGVSAVAIEDKIGLKKNSLFKNQKNTKQDKIKNFCKKIEKAKETCFSNDFQIIARIESLITGKGQTDALKRAEEYSKAGADLILIHSNKKDFTEIKQFCEKFSQSKYLKPIVAVPSSYSHVKEEELSKNNVKIVIYANQLMRASHKAMFEVGNKILKSSSSESSEGSISKIKDIISYIN